MTRKGLATGAGLALVSVGLVGVAPAQAAETLALAPSAGAEYAALTTSSFVLEAGFSGTESAAAQGTLKYRVVNAGTAALEVKVTEGADTSVKGYRYGTTTVELDNDALEASSDSATSDDDFVAFPDPASGVPAIGAVQSISIEPTAGFTDNISVTVQAWLDLDGDNAIDANEATSPVRTVTYYAAKNVTATAALESPVLGATALTANVTFSPALNIQQLDSPADGEDVVVKFLENTAVAAVTAGGVLTTATQGYFAASYDSAEAAFDADLTALGAALSAATVYGAEVLLWDGAGIADADYAKSGSAVYSGVSKGQVATLAASAVRAGNAVAGANLREGSGSFTVYADVSTVVTGAVVSGQTVTFTFTDTALTAGASVTVGGKTLTVAGTSITATAVSGANGEAELVVSYSGFSATDGDAISIEASAVGASAIIQGGNNAGADLTLTAHASTIEAVVDNIAGNEQVESVISSTTSISYTIADEFGQTPDGVFQLVMTEDGTGSFAGTVAVVGGKATYSWVENSPSANDYKVTATLHKKNGAGVFATTGSNETTEISAVTAAQVPAAITNTADDDGSVAAVALTLATQVSTDEQIDQTTIANPVTDTNFVKGTVTNATGAPLKGVKVTLSSAGKIMFTSEDGHVNGVGSLTVRTNTLGVYKVFVTSNSAGNQTVTATSGAASAAEVITFAAAAVGTATQISFAGSSATATSGSTFKIVATVSDTYGNPVDIDTADAPAMIVTYTGDGITLPTTLPTLTDAAGKLSFNVLLGSNDSNDGAVSVSYDLDGDGSLTDTGNVTATWTVDVNPVVAAAADTKVNAGSFKGFVAVYAKGHLGKRLSAKVGKDWVVVPALDSNFVRVVEYTGAGYTIAVRIYIDRVLVNTINVTTK